jgi:protein involved in polysaccharide export with SLBB domain
VAGVPSNLIDEAKAAVAQGGFTAERMQAVCAKLVERHMGADQVQAIGQAVGLSADQVAQLQSCVQSGGQVANASPGAALASASPTASPAVAEGPSSIEQSFRELANPKLEAENPSPADLSQFGYSFFEQPVSTFAPTDSVPVGPDYMIGPGDELDVLIWGRINDTLTLTVDRDGTIQIPQLGPLSVAGLTFAQARQLIVQRASQITGVQVDVTMGRLRTIQVFVIGEVEHPGTYTISALSRLSNALTASGGIKRVGSLRRVELRRGNHVVKVVDLYRMLLTGNTADDRRLQPNDVIFVPVIGPVVAVAGDVKRPAIYELASQSESLGAALRLAGGIGAFGYSQRVQVERVQGHERRIALDVYLSQAATGRFDIRDGDLIKVYTVLPERRNVVTLDGNVHRPGAYQWFPGMRVSDLVREGEGVKTETFYRYALVKRLQGKEKRLHTVPVDLEAVLNESSPGPADLALEPHDTLTIFNLTEMREAPMVRVEGEVRIPGEYPLSLGMRASDLVYLAGGLKDDAYLAKAELARTQVVNGTATRHIREDLDLRLALNGSDSSDPLLRPNDQLYIRRAENWHLPWMITIKGEVLRPGPYAVRKGERLSSIIQRTGGFLPDAYLPATIFVRTSIQEMEQKQLQQARVELQQQIAELELVPNPSSSDQSGGSSDNRTAALAMMQNVLNETQTQEATGRLVVRLEPLTEMVHSPDNVVLEDKDEITIPRRPVSVFVLGQVYSPNAILYRPHLTVSDYLQMAGGPKENADPDHIFVIKADGSVLTDEGIRNSERSRIFPLLPVISGGLKGARLGPGDTIYVPEELDYVNKLQVTKDITTIIANSAMSLGMMGILATSL